MAKKRNEEIYDQNIIEALRKLPNPIKDKKHNIMIYIRNDRARSNETRFEHIAKKNHELKVRDIKSIPEGIKDYVKFVKSSEIENTCYYFIKRKGEDRGFIQVAILLDETNPKRARIKTVFIAHRLK